MKSTPVVSSNFLERIADPASRFHPDYLSYRNREITQDELVARLPHVALIGDSVCTGVYISSIWSTFWRARTCRGNSWFLDTDPAPPGIRSVSKKLEEFTPFVAIECAGIGALVDYEGQPQNFFRRILRTRNFSGQVGDLLATRRFPDLILISIGHNNVDWAWRSPRGELQQPESRLQRQSQELRENFARQMRRLIDHAGLETTYKYLTSFRPAYRSNLIRLARMVNEELREMVSELHREFTDSAKLQVRYSDALATADLSRAELLHPIDGWHASVEGHNVLAEAAFADLGPSLEFLGIKRPRRGGFQSAPF